MWQIHIYQQQKTTGTKLTKMQLKNKKILVTGAGGFIGSHLVEELVKKGVRVRALVHYNSRNDWGKLEELPPEIISKVEVIAGDIRDPYLCQKITKNIDIIFHLAAAISIPFSYIAPVHYVETNINGTLNILESALKNNVKKVVNTSTSEVYGTAIYTPIDEKHPLQAQSPYSASKIAADKIAESYFCSYRLPIATIRPFNTFGPRQSARAIIPTIIIQLLSNRTKINVGNVEPIRDFTYVKDTVSGFIKIAESSASIGEVINIGSGRAVTIKELIHLTMKYTGRKAKIHKEEQRIRPEKSEVMALICSNKKALELLDWRPNYSLEEGLRETIGYIKEKINKYKVDLYNI